MEYPYVLQKALAPLQPCYAVLSMIFFLLSLDEKSPAWMAQKKSQICPWLEVFVKKMIDQLCRQQQPLPFA